jgi:hypothetical protein
LAREENIEVYMQSVKKPDATWVISLSVLLGVNMHLVENKSRCDIDSSVVEFWRPEKTNMNPQSSYFDERVEKMRLWWERRKDE